MIKSNFYTLDENERISLFQEISNKTGIPAYAVEKDWWVNQSLSIIFGMDIAKHIVFKGGTSLSKAWKLIDRFSEDIDLVIDKDFFMTSEKDWSKREITQLRKTASRFSAEIFYESLKSEFQKRGFNNIQISIVEAKDSDQDPRIIEIYYQNIISFTSDYISPRVQIEIGCRSLKEPFTVKRFGSLVDEFFSDSVFADPLIDVPVVNPERTLLEKLFLLHEEFHRPADKIRVDRLSRHLYDVYHLTKSGVGKIAISDQRLYETIVAQRHKFSRVGGVDYNLHNPATLNPIPPIHLMNEWKTDYEKMMEEMIYEQSPPTFEQLIENLNLLKEEIKHIDWVFQLSFSKSSE